MSNFVITKATIEGFCQKGLTVSEIASEISKTSGFKCSDAVIRTAAKHYGISLRNKPKKTPFTFEDNTAVEIQ